MKKKTIERKRIQRAEKKKETFKIRWDILASNIIIAIEEGSISYRDFKKASNKIDEKYWKPEWVPAPNLKE